MSAQDFGSATDRPFDYPLDTTRQPLPRGDTARSDIFAPLNKTQNDLQSELTLDPTASSTTSHQTKDFPPTNPFSHSDTPSLGLGNGTTGQQSSTLNSMSSKMDSKLDSKFDAAGSVGSGVPTTHYHNLVYDTFTWKYPRTTGMLFAGSLTVLLLGHYVNILRYAFKAAYITFAVSAAFDYLGRPTTGTGFMTQLRPAKYYTIPRQQLENVFAEMHEFTNFIVLEFQRILYVEKLSHTFLAAALSYFCYQLIKFLPVWGLILAADVALFTIPLVYLQNQEVIDHHVSRANSVVNEQLHTASVLAQKHTADVTNKAKVMASDLSGKASNAYQNRRQSLQSNGPVTSTGQSTGVTSGRTTGQITGQTTGQTAYTGQTAPLAHTAPPPPGPAPTLVEPAAPAY